uniref:Ureidoglycolate lyase n=1 Tax=Bosea sp. NBC_00436 TaxID=2969620 RepID=A0A9E7ZQ91_9HYPH
MEYDKQAGMPRLGHLLEVKPVTKSAFEPFGWIVETGDSGRDANNGTARRHDIHAHAATEIREDSRLVTSIFEAKRQSPGVSVAMLERHVNSTQLIVPLGGEGHVVIVSQASDDGMPDLSTLAAFSFTASQGMIYRRGVWHHPIMAVGSNASFLVQSWQNGTAADCEILTINPRFASRKVCSIDVAQP